jgi:hypothetical protein
MQLRVTLWDSAGGDESVWFNYGPIGIDIGLDNADMCYQKIQDCLHWHCPTNDPHRPFYIWPGPERDAVIDSSVALLSHISSASNAGFSWAHLSITPGLSCRLELTPRGQFLPREGDTDTSGSSSLPAAAPSPPSPAVPASTRAFLKTPRKRHRSITGSPDGICQIPTHIVAPLSTPPIRPAVNGARPTAHISNDVASGFDDNPVAARQISPSPFSIPWRSISTDCENRIGAIFDEFSQFVTMSRHEALPLLRGKQLTLRNVSTVIPDSYANSTLLHAAIGLQNFPDDVHIISGGNVRFLVDHLTLDRCFRRPSRPLRELSPPKTATRVLFLEHRRLDWFCCELDVTSREAPRIITYDSGKSEVRSRLLAPGVDLLTTMLGAEPTSPFHGIDWTGVNVERADCLQHALPSDSGFFALFNLVRRASGWSVYDGRTDATLDAATAYATWIRMRVAECIIGAFTFPVLSLRLWPLVQAFDPVNAPERHCGTPIRAAGLMANPLFMQPPFTAPRETAKSGSRCDDASSKAPFHRAGRNCT